MALQKGLWRLVGLASLLAVSTVATVAQQPSVGDESAGAVGASASHPPSWSVGCAAAERAAALSCAIEQRVFVANTGQLIGSVSVRVPDDTNGPVITIITPLGLFLPAGVSIAIDEDPAQTLEVQTCDARGCYAQSPVSENLLGKMFKGKQLNVRFQDMSKRPINLQLSLTGFTDAFAKIK